jgi:hypothetical protein
MWHYRRCLREISVSTRGDLHRRRVYPGDPPLCRREPTSATLARPHAGDDHISDDLIRDGRISDDCNSEDHASDDCVGDGRISDGCISDTSAPLAGARTRSGTWVRPLADKDGHNPGPIIQTQT